ncbi:RagB/SusD family nutrient uptake outer membrane protein [Pedobacter africanus]|uniref:RagB/SusD domain-containing protein n=1 Tax=Pedobacter africanus TaxID=151894 RepID=A0A1W2DHQ6_9SPHI|nr:RagB/SusD family nutrient uptake outer membrane protein [Pedobacter africanus]SMC97081.1 RagB/SusD domain-containing protein [Pedobacter africanus]
MKRLLGLLIFLIIIALNSACKKFLEIDPPKDKFGVAQVFENDETAISAITGIYSRMAFSGFASGDVNSVANLSGLTADEFRSHISSLDFFYQNEIPSSSTAISSLWTNIYTYIYTANAVIEGLPSSVGVTDATKKQLMGEAKFTRAFCYFYLVNLFGDVPLMVSTDYRTNDQAPRSSTTKVYEQIVTDLVDAETLLGNNYPTAERVRPNRSAAKALLARVYLYTKDWANAIAKATEIIDQKSTYTLVTDLDQVFLRTSKEAIWQLIPPDGRNTVEGGYFILTATPNRVSLTPVLMTAFSDVTDNRKTKWIGSFSNTTGTYYYPFKYKIKTNVTTSVAVTEYSMVIRLAELYLIRAEANAMLNKVDLSLEDIDAIRKRAGIVVPLTGLNQTQALAEIEKQRRLEFFSEWGHRWLDLKRLERATVVLSPLKGSTWKDTDIYYPLPDNEINRNNNLSQNLGY